MQCLPQPILYPPFFAHGMIIGRDMNNKTATGMNSSNAALAAQTTEGSTNPNCKAMKQSTHMTSNCYWPRGGKKGQFPVNFGQRNQANTATSTPASTMNSTPAIGQPKTFVLSTQILDTPGQSGVLINAPMDHPPMALISKGFQNF